MERRKEKQLLVIKVQNGLVYRAPEMAF